MIFRYFRALFVGEKTVEFYWNAAGLTGGLLLLGSIVADKENYDLLFSNNNNSSSSSKTMKPAITNPLDSHHSSKHGDNNEKQ